MAQPRPNIPRGANIGPDDDLEDGFLGANNRKMPPPRELKLDDDDNPRAETRRAVEDVLRAGSSSESSNKDSWFTRAINKAKGLGTWSLEKTAELRSAAREIRQLRRAHARGELTREMLEEAMEAIGRLLGFEAMLALAPFTIVPLVAWQMGAREHELQKIEPDYSGLAEQIMNLQEDEDEPGSYVNAVESLCAGLQESRMHKEYRTLSSVHKFKQAYGTVEGREKIKGDLGKLLGPEVDEIHELTESIKNLATRLGIEIVGAPPAARFTPGTLKHRYASHCLTALSSILARVYNEVTEPRLAEIISPHEEVQLDKDMDKLGDTLMDRVQGSSRLATQFLRNLNLNTFDKKYGPLLNATKLQESVEDEPNEVRDQLYGLFGLSGHVDSTELDAFTAALIGPTPYSGPIPTNQNGGALGVRDQLDTATQAIFDSFREKVDQARTNLLTPFPGSTETPLSILFPPKTETINYSTFGSQLGKAIRGKTGLSLQRARSAFLRGWDEGSFENQFLLLVDDPSFKAAMGGDPAGRELIKTALIQMTGAHLPQFTTTVWSKWMQELRTAIGVNGGGPPPVPYTFDSLSDPTLSTKQARLAVLLYEIEERVAPELDALYATESLEKNLGAVINGAPPTKVVDIFNRINMPFLIRNYSLLTQSEATVRALAPVDQKKYKDQLASFLGAPRGFLWNDTTVRGLVMGLEAQAAIADRYYGPGGGKHPGADVLETWIRTYVGPLSPAFITLLGSLR